LTNYEFDLRSYDRLGIWMKTIQLQSYDTHRCGQQAQERASRRVGYRQLGAIDITIKGSREWERGLNDGLDLG